MKIKLFENKIILYLLLLILLLFVLYKSMCNCNRIERFNIGGQQDCSGEFKIKVGDGECLNILSCEDCNKHCGRFEFCPPQVAGESCSNTCPKKTIVTPITHFDTNCSNCSGNYKNPDNPDGYFPPGSKSANSSNIYPCNCASFTLAKEKPTLPQLKEYCKQFSDEDCCPHHTNSGLLFSSDAGVSGVECSWDDTTKCTSNATCAILTDEQKCKDSPTCCYNSSLTSRIPNFQFPDGTTCADHPKYKECIVGCTTGSKESCSKTACEIAIAHDACKGGNYNGSCTNISETPRWKCDCKSGFTGSKCDQFKYKKGTAFMSKTDSTIIKPISCVDKTLDDDVCDNQTKMTLPLDNASFTCYYNKEDENIKFNDSGEFTVPNMAGWIKSPAVDFNGKYSCPYGAVTCNDDTDCSNRLCSPFLTYHECKTVDNNVYNYKCNSSICESIHYTDESDGYSPNKNVSLNPSTTTDNTIWCGGGTKPKPGPKPHECILNESGCLSQNQKCYCTAPYTCDPVNNKCIES